MGQAGIGNKKLLAEVADTDFFAVMNIKVSLNVQNTAFPGICLRFKLPWLYAANVNQEFAEIASYQLVV